VKLQMTTDRIIYYCLLFSLSVHLIVLSIFSFFHFKMAKKTHQAVEIIYSTRTKAAPLIPIQTKEKEVSLLKEKKTAPKLDILTKKMDSPMSFQDSMKDMTKSGEMNQTKKEVQKITSFEDASRRVTVPLLKSEKITNPKYLSYNEAIRQKIRQRAFTFVNHPDFKQGEVYLTFVLDSNGNLKDLKIIDSKTHANDYLRGVGVKSVEQSSPFSPFPADLHYDELTFNVVISFQVDEE
jgi:outer membrane biosynthesis protein TonB